MQIYILVVYSVSLRKKCNFYPLYQRHMGYKYQIYQALQERKKGRKKHLGRQPTHTVPSLCLEAISASFEKSFFRSQGGFASTYYVRTNLHL